MTLHGCGVGRWLLPVALASASLTCSSDGNPSEPQQPRPAFLVRIAGDGQNGPVNEPLPDSLVVRVEDSRRRPLASIPVTWTIDGGGSVSKSTVTSGSNGRAAVERTLGPAAGEQITTATAGELPPLTFTSIGNAGAEPQLIVATEPSHTTKSGVLLGQQPVLRIDDGTGESLGGGIPVTVSVTGASLDGTTKVKSDAYGEVHFEDLALEGPQGTYRLTFSAPNLVGVLSDAITLVSNQPATPALIITTQPSTAADGGVPFQRQPVLRLENGEGEPLGAGVPVTASVTGASLTGATTVETNGNGVARFRDLVLTGPDGSYTMTFGSPGAQDVQSTDITLATASTEAGEWSRPFAWPIVAVHMILLPTGRVLSIGRTGVPQVWDPVSGDFTAEPSPAWLFCAGHVLLADGRVLVAGGHISDGHGLPNITYFSGSGTWTTGPAMARGRWYPTATVMGNGDVVITAGTDQDSMTVLTPEVWSDGSVRQLGGATLSLPWYPRAFLAPDGSLFVAGPQLRSRFLSLSGSGAWANGPTQLFGESRSYGSAVMYDDGKILYAGGGFTTNTAEVIDLNQSNPSWRWTSPMAFKRRHLNLTVLPTGDVLATGGVAGTTFDDVSKGVHPAEIWHPQTGHWTTLASNVVTRGYHSTSLLLPDGRVLHAGSGNGAGAPDEFNAEIFSPPYLSRGPRPVLTSVPDDLGYGEQFRLLTPQAGSVAQVSLIRLGSVTHAFDQNQRFQRLAFTADGSGLTVTAPSSSNRAPPGHYMLFIVNGAGVPSVGAILRIH
jgi:hypothetical protein